MALDSDALRSSWAEVVPLGETAAEIFYGGLFVLAPELRVMFPAAMGGQRDRLLAALGHIVSNVDDTEALTEFVEQLGRDHRRFAVRPEHYPIVGKALVFTLKTGLGERWTDYLQEQWIEAYSIVSAAMIDAARRYDGKEPSYWDAEVLDRDQRCGDITVLTIRPDPTGPPFRYTAGESISVESSLRANVWRYFSPANAARRDGTIDLHVRAVDGGQLSPALCYQTQPGDVLRLGSPIGGALTVPPVTPPMVGPDLLLIAGGTGLAPLKAVVEQLAANLDTRRVTLVHGARYRGELYDLDRLQALAEEYRQLTVIPAMSHEVASEIAATPVEAALRARDTWKNHRIYVCGSPAMVAETCSRLSLEGYNPGDVHVEPYDGTTYAPLQQGLTPEEIFERAAR